MQLSTEIREALIGIGRSVVAGAPPSIDVVESVRDHDYINRQGRVYWHRAVLGKSDEDVGHLACGLTYIEAKYEWKGGSVSGVVWLFQELTRRNAGTELLDGVSSWILQNTSNPYNPFRTMRSHGAKSYSDYLVKDAAHWVRFLKAVANLKQSAQVEREARRKRAANGAEARNTKTRTEIIETLNPLPLAEKLRRISIDPNHPPQFFPTSIPDSATQQDVDSLPDEIKKELARRLKGKRKGPWGNFKKKLNKAIGQFWNRTPWRV